MNFKGKITSISTVKTGKTKKGDDWASLDFEVTESEPNNQDYPQIALFSYFKSGEYFKYANEFKDNNKLGDEVNVEFNFKCQVYTKKDGSGEGKFYKNECWKIEKLVTGAEPLAPVAPLQTLAEKDDDLLPF